jgi:hypothetical protein
MSNLWSPDEVRLKETLVLGNSLANFPISKEFKITAGGSMSLVAVVETVDVTKGNGITIKFQTGVDGIYQDSKTVSIEDDGTFIIRFNNAVSGDHQYLPLLASGRLLVTTGNNSVLTVTSIKILQAD